MPYPDVQGLVNALASFYDDTDTDNFAVPGPRINRYLHYIQLGVYEIWSYRPWSFKMAYYTANFPAGEMALPPSFANVGPSGALFDSSGYRWNEIAFQTMVRLRAASAGSSKKPKVFAVGTLSPGTLGAEGDGGIQTGAERGLIIPDNANAETFLLYYETSPPLINTTSLTNPIPLPESFHEPLLYVAVSKLQEAKADPRDTWKQQYLAQLSKLAEIYFPLGSRMLQMPMTGGRMW